MTSSSPIEALADDTRRLLVLAQAEDDFSFELAVDLRLRRVMVVSVASLFEEQVKEIIGQFCSAASDDCAELIALMRSQVTARGYHTLFDWKAGNVNRFLSVFGTAFSDQGKIDIDENDDLKEGARAFVQLGALRNDLVHNNFESAPVDLTMTEILERYEQAKLFIAYIEHQLLEVACGRAEEK